MNAAVSGVEELQNRVKALLKQENIKTVAMIDDAYQVPTYGDIRSELDAFIQKLVDEDRTQELADLCEWPSDREIHEGSQFNDEEVRVMRERCAAEDADGIAGELRDEVFQTHVDNCKPVEFIHRTLSDLELKVHRFHPQTKELPEDADIWMWDLFWNLEGPATDWYRAAEVARKQFDARKPSIFVLMSSYGPALEEKRDTFRSRAKLPAGTFHIWKKRLSISENDVKALLRWLASVLESLPFRKRVFGLVEAIETAAEQALNEYKKSLHNLAPEDYAHIYRYSLEADGHPLGDYMMWMLEPLFEHHLRQNDKVQELRAALDELSGEDIPPYDYLDRPPSTALRGIHQRRIWQEIDKRLTSTQDHGIPRIHQGDLLSDVNDNTCVFLVLNADCDLAFSEAGGQRTKPKEKLSVLLLPGIIEDFSIETKTADQTEFTYFYDCDAHGSALQAHRIRWHLAQVTTRKYAEISAEEYGRRWRLHRPYLTKLVQRWSHHVTREGTPVSPPVIEKLHVSKVRWRATKKDDWQEQPIPHGPHESYLFSRIDDKGKKSNKLVMRDCDRLFSTLKDLVPDMLLNVLDVVEEKLQHSQLDVPDESKRVKFGNKSLLCLKRPESVPEKIQLIILLEATESAL